MIFSKRFEQQIDKLIDRFDIYNKKLLQPRTKQDYIYLRYLLKQLVKNYNDRGKEIASPEYQKVKTLANSHFPVRTLWIECIDGRVLSIYAHGATANVGSSIRVPGGNLREFIRDTNGHLKLMDNSDFAIFVRRAFTDFGVNEVAEVFDSHIGCAARFGEEISKGKNPLDSGLLADVIHKSQIAKATKEYVENVFGNSKRIITIQTSFDPHTGFLYMGLETKAALSYAVKNGNAYTSTVLDQLVEKGKIISTEQFIQQPQVAKILKEYEFTLDWQTKYVQTADLFWKKLSVMRTKLLPLLVEKLRPIYPELNKKNIFNDKELEERAALLLTNVYSGYLNNSHHRDTTVEHDVKYIESFHGYPYGEHKEQGVRVAESAYSPYKISVFAVFNGEERNLADDIELAVSLVRKNRKEGRVTDPTKSFSTTESFAEATVPIIVQEVVRENITTEEFSKLDKIEWDDLPTNWNTMETVEFLRYLKTKEIAQLSLAMSIDKLRRHMSLLYNPFSSLSSRLIENYEVALPVVVGKYRESIFIIPFVKLGYE